MRKKSDTPAAGGSTSGIEHIRFAVSGRNRFVTFIALLAALGGFLFGYDTGIIGQALAAIGFIWWRVPETSGKSLEQIEHEVGATPSADR